MSSFFKIICIFNLATFVASFEKNETSPGEKTPRTIVDAFDSNTCGRFSCHYCMRGITENQPVYMGNDFPYCSHRCRGRCRGFYDHYQDVKRAQLAMVERERREEEKKQRKLRVASTRMNRRLKFRRANQPNRRKRRRGSSKVSNKRPRGGKKDGDGQG